jgi:hypothetical protein
MIKVGRYTIRQDHVSSTETESESGRVTLNLVGGQIIVLTKEENAEYLNAQRDRPTAKDKQTNAAATAKA